jgi:quinol monooxygenase YgiN
MIFIVVKFTVRPEHSGEWLDHVDDFTRATRREPGNLWFEWSRSADDPDQYVLVEAFRDGDAGVAHVQSQHFKEAIDKLPPYLARTPEIINVEVPGTGWSEMGEMKVGSGAGG